MKLIACQKCNDIMMLIGGGMTRTCFCGEVGGKYLDDNITAVVNEDAIVVGIDNNGFNIAKTMVKHQLENDIKYRIDYFFTGWIPTIPGEVIVVESVEHVLEYDYHIRDEDKNYGSTLPTEISEFNEINDIIPDYDIEESQSFLTKIVSILTKFGIIRH